MNHPTTAPVLVTGATGYIGGRLVPRLLAAGHPVRCFVRDRQKLARRDWFDDPRVEVIEGSADDPERLRLALAGCGAAYYLIHSMLAAGPEYRERDRRLARTFARMAAETGVERIVYLGGLGETGEGLSEHLRSRREVEDELASTGVPVTVLRAAMIIGSGSASFEILRYLVERLPAMITPKWVRTEAQPIAVDDALHYLVACLSVPETAGRTLDIGGPDVVTYHEIMQETARQLRLRRKIIVPVPVLTPKLSSLWIHLVTPVSHRIARPLAEGLRNRVVCRDDEAVRLMPHERLDLAASIGAALGHASPESAWTDAGPIPGDPDWAGGKVFVDRRSVPVGATPEATFTAVCSLGGRQGWFQADWLWRLRGAMDRLVGGPGLARGRRDPDHLAYGDVLDFWRVTAVERDRRLELRAEMKLPGEAELAFRIDPADGDRCTLVQTARFKPRGFLGLLYWWMVIPFHGIVFRNMLHGVRDRAETLTDPPPPLPHRPARTAS
jgi:uncharacterized protein YbjT (DUF2867 family)